MPLWHSNPAILRCKVVQLTLYGSINVSMYPQRNFSLVNSSLLSRCFYVLFECSPKNVSLKEQYTLYEYSHSFDRIWVALYFSEHSSNYFYAACMPPLSNSIHYVAYFGIRWQKLVVVGHPAFSTARLYGNFQDTSFLMFGRGCLNEWKTLKIHKKQTFKMCFYT